MHRAVPVLAVPVLVVLSLAPAASSQAQTDAGPARKPGWWEMQLTLTGPTPTPAHQTVHLCTDAAVDKVQSPLGVNMNSPACPPPKIARTATGWTVAGSCNTGQMTITANAVATGDFNDRYHVDIDTRLDPPPAPQAAEIKIAMDAHWVGECPAGKKPGDVESSGQIGPPPPPSN
jgi:hypothetical protein